MDEPRGWDQELQLECCDTEGQAGELYDIPVPSIVVFMPHDERFARYDEDLNDAQSLESFIVVRRHPTVMELNEDTVERFLGWGEGYGEFDEQYGLPILFLVNADEKLKAVMHEAAKALHGRVLLCFSGTQSDLERRLMETLDVDDATAAAAVLVKVQQNNPFELRSVKTFRLPLEGLQVAGVESFLDDFWAGKLRPSLRSEPLPQEEGQGLVKVLVGQNFEASALLDKDHDVLVNIFAPWCGHCHKFEPHYQALARRLRHVTSLLITKLDGSRNEIEGLSVAGFPTILLFPAGEHKMDRRVQYEGHRRPEDMTRWLHRHCARNFSDTPPPNFKPAGEAESGLLDPEEEEDNHDL